MTTQPAHVALSDLTWTFGDRIRKIRRIAGASQVDFAKTIQCTQKSLAAWELGASRPRNIVSIAQRIELAYGVPAAWTLGLNENTRPDGPDGSSAPPTGLEPVTL